MIKIKPKQLLKPGLKLIGAKTKIRQRLYDLFPKDYDMYVEPFMGTLGVLIGHDPVEHEFAYDLNEHVINYYKVLQNSPDEFWVKLQSWLQFEDQLTKSHFTDLKYDLVRSTDDIERAVYHYLIVKSCWNGILRFNQAGECNSSFNTFQKRGWFTPEWFWQVVERVKKVKFNVQDYKTTLSIDYPKSAFIFVDPPYRACKTTYNGQKFSDQDHIDLFWLLDELNCKWMLTINDDEFTRDLYKNYNIIAHDVAYSCSQTNSGRGKKPELIVTNY